MSVAKSIKNDAQKSLSSVILADIYYDQQNYRFSQAYYDTAVAFMSLTTIGLYQLQLDKKPNRANYQFGYYSTPRQHTACSLMPEKSVWRLSIIL